MLSGAHVHGCQEEACHHAHSYTVNVTSQLCVPWSGLERCPAGTAPLQVVRGPPNAGRHQEVSTTPELPLVEELRTPAAALARAILGPRYCPAEHL
jgi:hypothetical protein